MNVQTIGPKGLEQAAGETVTALSRTDSGKPDAVEVEVMASAATNDHTPTADTLETALQKVAAERSSAVRFAVEGKGYRQSSSVFVVRAVAT